MVTALALAAVLGAMSLANPAQAAFEAPAGSQLTERVDQPLMVEAGIDDLVLWVTQTGTTDINLEGSADSQMGFPFRFDTEAGDRAYTAEAFTYDAEGNVPDAADTTTVSTSIGGTPAITLSIDPVAVGKAKVVVSGTQTVANGDDHTAMVEFDVTVVAANLMSSSDSPGGGSRYVITFAPAEIINALDGQITIELPDFDVPGSIDPEHVVIRQDANAANPQAIESDDEEIILHVGDMTEADGIGNIAATTSTTITIQSSAGVKLPSEGGDYAWSFEYGDSSADTTEVHVARKVSLDEDDGGRGDMLTATGKGFKNGTTLHFWLDTDMNGLPGSAEFTLCSTMVGSDDTGSCEFEVTNPPFMGGMNYVNAIDGRSNRADMGEHHEFELTASMSVTPNGGTPGESLLIELFDFADTGAISKVELARRTVCGGDSGTSCTGVVNQTGNGNFRLIIPDNTAAGIQDLRVTVGGTDASTTVIISGPMIRVTPSQVVANQRISLVGGGFNSGAGICTGRVGDEDAVISIGGSPIDCRRVNGGDPVSVDSGGNWSAAVDLPLDASTVEEGDRDIKVRDSNGRTGQVRVTIPSRTVSITPDTGRVGTLAVVRGENFPSKNDEGDSFNVEIVYESAQGRTTTSAQPDASGSFEAEIRVPTTAGIPSTNTVKVQFEYGDANTPVITAVTHDVPEGTIELSRTSGSPGSTIDITGEGFKQFVPVSSVHVGGLDVTPAPKPSTDAQGRLDFSVQIPGLDNGIQTIEVQVGQTTASKGFTVKPSGINPGDIVEVALGLENLGDNLDSIWHFNNDSKMWSFYDGLEGSDLTELITGETYLIQIKSTVEVILNNKTRNLTCNDAGNCWNQIVW